MPTIVAEGTALPSSYGGRFFAADPLHRNIVVAERYARGSTFETRDQGIALAGADPAFRPVYLTNAPDGAIYVADFYEEFIAHGQNYQGQIDPSTGRIYRIRGKNLPLNTDVNLAPKRILNSSRCCRIRIGGNATRRCVCWQSGPDRRSAIVFK
jgi:hypothetical protein